MSITEKEHWEDSIYQIKPNDRVLGGPNGPANKAVQQLANRTRYLKHMIDKLTQDIENIEGNITLPSASLTQAGIVQLGSQIDSDSESIAATLKAVSMLAKKIPQGTTSENTWKHIAVSGNTGGYIELPSGLRFAWKHSTDITVKPGETREIKWVYPFPKKVYYVGATRTQINTTIPTGGDAAVLGGPIYYRDRVQIRNIGTETIQLTIWGIGE